MDYRARIIGPGVLRLLANDLPDLAHDEVVFVSIERGRSPNSHKHQFAWVNDAWQNLPEAEALQPYAETAETLRKHALIATGYHRTYTIDCGGKATAQRIKAELLRAATKAEGYALAQVKGPILRIWTPESQSVRAMGGKRFQESKSVIMDWIAGKLGVTADELRSRAA